jgi:hypothetical protein
MRLRKQTANTIRTSTRRSNVIPRLALAAGALGSTLALLAVSTFFGVRDLRSDGDGESSVESIRGSQSDVGLGRLLEGEKPATPEGQPTAFSLDITGRPPGVETATVERLSHGTANLPARGAGAVCNVTGSVVARAVVWGYPRMQQPGRFVIGGTQTIFVRFHLFTWDSAAWVHSGVFSDWQQTTGSNQAKGEARVSLGLPGPGYYMVAVEYFWQADDAYPGAYSYEWANDHESLSGAPATEYCSYF